MIFFLFLNLFLEQGKKEAELVETYPYTEQGDKKSEPFGEQVCITSEQAAQRKAY